jgi:hypothetical protein
MDRRLQLQTLLEETLGSSNVYFQPPANIVMQYPCIVYSRETANNQYADNQAYRNTKRYTVTHIDRNPDSEGPDKIARLPLCAFSRHFTTEGLHHDVYNLYF